MKTCFATLSAEAQAPSGLAKKEMPIREFRALRGATAERGGSAKPFGKGLSENGSIGSS